MAEATDRPPDPKGFTTPTPTASAAGAAAPEDAPKPYSSLSLLALAGLAVAVVYALLVVVGAILALLNRTPWILPVWSLLFPLGALVVCWAARVQIQNSEGALTGTRLTTWGIRLSAVVALVYGAYYAASYLSITQQGASVGDEWFNDLKADRLDKAFLLTVKPPRPADDASLRDRLEMDYDRGRDGKGPFTDFRQSEIVRQMEQGGPASQVQCLGVKDWGYEAGGYQVQLRYRLSTPAMNTEMIVTVVGVENADDSGGRQWYVKGSQLAGQPVLTPEGQRMDAQSNASRTFAQAWLDKVKAWDWDAAYLDTLPPAERRRQDKERGPEFEAGKKAFREGGLVHVDPEKFWAGAKEKDKVVALVKSLFGAGGENPDKLFLQTALPTYRRDADQVHFGYDLMIPLPPHYLVQSQLVVAADAGNADPGPDDWRIELLDLVSGKTMAGPPPGPGMPGMSPMGRP